MLQNRSRRSIYSIYMYRKRTCKEELKLPVRFSLHSRQKIILKVMPWKIPPSGSSRTDCHAVHPRAYRVHAISTQPCASINQIKCHLENIPPLSTVNLFFLPDPQMAKMQQCVFKLEGLTWLIFFCPFFLRRKWHHSLSLNKNRPCCLKTCVIYYSRKKMPWLAVPLNNIFN